MRRDAYYRSNGKYFRRSFRFPIETPVHVLRGPTRYAYGVTLNMSRDGAAIKVLPLLEIGEDYELFLEGFGRLDASIVRKFDGYCFGLRFKISEDCKKRLDRAIARKLGVAEDARVLAKVEDAAY